MACGTLGWADRVTLKNGNVLDGQVVQQDSAEVSIKVGSVVQTIDRRDISELFIEDPARVGPGEAAGRAATQRALAGEYGEAWTQFVAMYKLEPGAATRHADGLRMTMRALLALAQRQIDENAPGNTLAILDPAAEEPGPTMLAVALPDEAKAMLDDMTRLRADAARRLSTFARRNGRLEDAERMARRAVAISAVNSPEGTSARAELGLVLRDMGDAALKANDKETARKLFEEALATLDLVAAAPGVDEALARNAESTARNIRSIQLDPLVTALNPTPTPASRRELRTATPTPTPTPGPDYGYLGDIAGDEAAARAEAFVRPYLGGRIEPRAFFDYLILALAFVVGFWVLPSVILRIIGRWAPFSAPAWRKRVWYLGPLAVIGCLVSLIWQAPKAVAAQAGKHKCVHCGFVLDDYLSYTNLNFSQCPNCGGEVNPVHTLDEYITFLGNALATDVEKVAMGIVTMARFVEKDTMQRLLRGLVTLAIRRRASDIHIEPEQRHVVIRYRLDGIMTEMAKLPPSLGPAIVSAIKVQCQLDISEKRKPQDGKMRMWVDGADIDVRVATSPASGGETATMRLLDARNLKHETKNLGMSKSTREIFDRAINEPHGLILVTGPTGSGKTTTLYVALKQIQNGEKNIISIEDPIEFSIQGVNQMQINPVAGLTFATALRSILRQDPDVIMVGEIRDKETAEISINAAQTGHLVFSTLHTIDTAASIARLYDLGINPRQFADALSLIVAQRLIRLICQQCKVEDTPKEAILREIGITPEREAEYPFFRGKGCNHCSHTGFYGRAGIFELLVPNETIRVGLERGTMSTPEIRALAVSCGMRTLREEALVFLKQGLTTADEVLRVTK